MYIHAGLRKGNCGDQHGTLGNWDENCFPTIFIIHPSVVQQWRVGAGSLCPRAREEERTNEEEEEGDQQLQI